MEVVSDFSSAEIVSKPRYILLLGKESTETFRL